MRDADGSSVGDRSPVSEMPILLATRDSWILNAQLILSGLPGRLKSPDPIEMTGVGAGIEEGIIQEAVTPQP